MKLSIIKIYCFTLSFFTLVYNCSFSQSPVNENVKVNPMSFCEELYVNTDRDIYITGEKVWLKIYKLNGITLAPVNISKVVYLDLLDNENNPVKQMKIFIDGNSGSADFMIPATLSTGNYIIRSYTNWMKNFSQDLFSYKSIAVINPFKKIDEIKTISSNGIPDSVLFFPEGGHLIKGIETRLGFCCLNKEDDPVIINGAIIDEGNDTVCYVKTGPNGYGWARINPLENQKFYLVMLENKGPVRKFPLPDIQEEGITFVTSQQTADSQIQLKIIRSNNFKTSGKRFFVKMYSAGLVNGKREINIETNNEIVILNKELPKGLSRLMILDEQDNLLCSRWIYNKNEKKIYYSFNIQDTSFQTRGRIKVDITATDEMDAPVESEFSISVAKAFTINKNNFNNSNYRQLPELATLETTNSLPDINDYLIFYNSQDKSYNPLLNDTNSVPVYLPELEGLSIKGQVYDKITGEPINNKDIALSFIGKVALCHFTKTDEKGNFNFITREHGLKEMVIQPVLSELNNYNIELNNPFISDLRKYNHRPFYLNSSKLDQINNAIINMQIKELYEPFSNQNNIEKIYPVRPDFFGKPDYDIQISRYIELDSIQEIIKEIVPIVFITRKDNRYNFNLHSPYDGIPFDREPLILVDGVGVTDLEQIVNIKPTGLEKIKVVSSRYYISDVIYDGVLHFISKKGNLGVIDFDKSVYRREYYLLENENKFNSPDYSLDSLKNNRVPDYRNTLYWNPDLHTDKTGHASVEFYASDEADEYIIDIEGITSDGKSGSSSIPITVID